MHFCPHCIFQTIVWLFGTFIMIPFISISFRTKMYNLIDKIKCRKEHSCSEKHKHRI